MATKRKMVSLGGSSALRWGGKKGVKVGFSLTGEYAGSIPGKFGKIHSVADTKTGEIVRFFGTANLDSMLEGVKNGRYIEIEYTGQEKVKAGAHKGKPVHTFDVQAEAV